MYTHFGEIITVCAVDWTLGIKIQKVFDANYYQTDYKIAACRYRWFSLNIPQNNNNNNNCGSYHIEFETIRILCLLVCYWCVYCYWWCCIFDNSQTYGDQKTIILIIIISPHKPTVKPLNNVDINFSALFVFISLF